MVEESRGEHVAARHQRHVTQPAVQTAPPGSTGSQQAIHAESMLKTGQLVGGNRFRVDRYLGASSSTINYFCHDNQTNKTVVLKLIRRELNATPEDLKQISQAVTNATSIKSDGLAAILGMGTTGAGDSFIISEYIEGPTLGFILSDHRSSGKTISIRDLFAVMSHLGATLQVVHKTMIHAVITPYNIHITRTGGVLLSNLGIGSELATIEARALHSGPYYDSIYVAPEILEMPEMVTNVADVFSLGMIAVELLHPEGLASDRVLARQQAQAFLPSLPPAIRKTIASAIEPNITLRTTSIEKFIAELEASSMQMEGDVFREPGPGDLPVRALRSDQTEEDLFDLPEFALPTTNSESERYLLQINGLDYGPFTAGEVYKKLYADEIDENTEILDRNTQIRCKLVEAEYFREKVEEYIPQRNERLRRQAEQREKNIQRVKSGGLGIFITGIVVSAVVLGVLGFFLYRLPPQEPLPIAIALPKQNFVFSPPPKDFVAVKVDKGFLELLFNPKASDSEIAKKLGKRKRPAAVAKKKQGGAGGGGGGSDENVTEVDLNSSGTNHVLTDEEVNDVIMSDFSAMRRCIMAQLKEEPGFRGITILFFVRPSGTPGGVKIKEKRYQGTTVGQCLVSRFRNMRFPAHGGFNRSVAFPLNVQ